MCCTACTHLGLELNVSLIPISQLFKKYFEGIIMLSACQKQQRIKTFFHTKIVNKSSCVVLRPPKSQLKPAATMPVKKIYPYENLSKFIEQFGNFECSFPPALTQRNTYSLQNNHKLATGRDQTFSSTKHAIADQSQYLLLLYSTGWSSYSHHHDIQKNKIMIQQA